MKEASIFDIGMSSDVVSGYSLIRNDGFSESSSPIVNYRGQMLAYAFFEWTASIDGVTGLLY